MKRYIGGDRLSQGERAKLVLTHLRPLRGIDLGWQAQCFCGSTIYVEYRGRLYCQQCGYRPRFTRNEEEERQWPA